MAGSVQRYLWQLFASLLNFYYLLPVIIILNCNLSDDEFSAVHTLKTNRNIAICKSDKGNAIVVIDQDDYIERARMILSRSQFESISNANILQEKEEYMNKYIRSLFNINNIIDRKLFYRIQSISANIPVFYGFPKIHKAAYQLRPIVSSIGSYQYNLAKYLASMISDCSSTSPLYVKDSFSFSNMIKNLILEPTQSYTMCSFDVESLNTNMLVRKSIEIALDLMFQSTQCANTPLNRDQIKTLLECPVYDVPFRFQNKIYMLKDGIAMGSPLASILANLFMTQMEENLNHISPYKPTIWLRCVDNIFCVFTISCNEIIHLQTEIKKWYTHFKFMIEWEENGQSCVS